MHLTTKKLPASPSRLSVRVTQWGSLAVASLLGVALVASGLLNYRSAQGAAESMTVREGHAVWGRLLVDWSAGTDALRQALLAGLKDSGATYLAVWEKDTLLTETGNSAFPGRRPTPFQLQTGPDRARMSFPFIGLFASAPDGSGAPVVRPVAESTSYVAQNRLLVLEFNPTASHAMVQRALVGLVLSSSAAVLLTSAALVLWRFGRRAECLRAELDRKEHLARLGTMSAVLAHELKNPLSALKGNIQLLAEDPTSPRIRARIERVVEGARRLEVLIRDLLSFAQSGTVRLAPSSPAKVLEAAALVTAPARIELSLGNAPDIWMIDAARIEQVLVNLLDNALKVTPGDQVVSATVSGIGKELVYSVRDRGPGVPASERQLIFQPFHTTNVRGTGLGLAVARRILELHGGRIDVDDAPEGGAVFRVFIPQRG